MKRILLICALGMSSSMICEKMKKVRTEEESDWTVEAREQGEFKDIVQDYDLVLLSPQVRFLKDDFAQLADPHGIPILVIDPMDYGTVNAARIMDKVRAALN